MADIEISINTELEADLADLAADLTAKFDTMQQRNIDDALLGNACTLLGPSTLTVHTEGRGYKKVPHLGGEDFIPLSAYVGKKNRIIVVFKPVTASSYETMEMSADEAVTSLSGFDALASTDAGHYRARMKQISTSATKLKEIEAAKSKVDDYDDFGTF